MLVACQYTNVPITTPTILKIHNGIRFPLNNLSLKRPTINELGIAIPSKIVYAACASFFENPLTVVKYSGTQLITPKRIKYTNAFAIHKNHTNLFFTTYFIKISFGDILLALSAFSRFS